MPLADREKRNAYLREYYRRNPERQHQAYIRYRDKQRAEGRKRAPRPAEQEAVRRNSARAWQAHRRRSFYRMLSIIKDEPCLDCGVRYPTYVMQFDHVTGRKEANVSQMYGKSILAIMNELEKCELVCANCHCERTFGGRKQRNPS